MAEPHPRTVVIVDDDAPKRYLLQRLVRTLGVEVVEVGTCADAIARAGDPVALWVVDVRLPDADGFTLCRELRAKGITAPIVLVSTLFELHDAQDNARAAGATAWSQGGDHGELQKLLTAQLGAPR